MRIKCPILKLRELYISPPQLVGGYLDFFAPSSPWHSLPPTSPSALLLDRPGSTSPRRRAGHPPPRGAYRGGRWAAREFGAGSCTGGVEQNVQVPKGGGRGIRIGPQGLPLLHRRALRLRLGLMDAPPRHLQGTPALPFPFAPDRSDPP